jgi:DNA mismatch endonuclease (patch repair protein)
MYAHRGVRVAAGPRKPLSEAARPSEEIDYCEISCQATPPGSVCFTRFDQSRQVENEDLLGYIGTMADIVEKKTRSRMMSRIRGSNTKPEILLRKALHAEGFRFRINVRKLPGTPDIVLKKWNTVIHVNGCFWHQHPVCPKATSPSSNTSFWQNKFAANVERDRRALLKLDELGWRTLTIWECAIGREVAHALVDEIASFLGSPNSAIGRSDDPVRHGEIAGDGAGPARFAVAHRQLF